MGDRAYFSYDLINTLNKHKLYFVIRVKNNCLCINDKNVIKNKINNDNVRFITNKSIRHLNVKDETGKEHKLEETILCNLVTNLPLKDYNDESIKKIYLARWDSQ